MVTVQTYVSLSLVVDTVRTRSRSNRNGAVLGSKEPRQGLPFLYGPSQYLLQAALCLNQIIRVNSNNCYKKQGCCVAAILFFFELLGIID